MSLMDTSLEHGAPEDVMGRVGWGGETLCARRDDPTKQGSFSDLFPKVSQAPRTVPGT